MKSLWKPRPFSIGKQPFSTPLYAFRFLRRFKILFPFRKSHIALLLQFTYSLAFFKIGGLTKPHNFRIILSNILKANEWIAEKMISGSLFIIVVLLAGLILIESPIAVGRQKGYVKVEVRRKK